MALAVMTMLPACATETTRPARASAAQAAAPAPKAKKPPSDGPAYGARSDVVEAAASFAQQHQLDPDWVRRALAKARYQPQVAKAIMPPPVGVAKNWAAYRSRFVEPLRIGAGLSFWDDQAEWLSRAEERYGVPASIIVGIIGVETLYGRHTGGFRAIDALATLAFDFPAGRKDRSGFFRDELGEWLALASREGLDPTEPRGSYAGALGLPQFMPSSWNRYAIDFDGDGHVDLWNEPADAIGSVAHYLAEHGWVRGEPTLYDVIAPADTAERATLLVPDILPSFTVEEMRAHGAQLPEVADRHAGKLALVELQNGDAAPSYIAGTQNFYAVTRYNWSAYYALAVIELGRTIEAARLARR